MSSDLRQSVLTATRPHFHPELRRARWEGRQRLARKFRRECQARERNIEQNLLPQPQLVAASAAVQPVRRWLQRWKAAFRPGARSVLSHVNVPLSSSESRPKCPYAEVGT